MKKYLPAALLFFVFLIYFITKPPSILWIDSGTMIAASATLGIPNPPGFPFYMMLSHIFGLIPLGNWLTRLELFSIIFSIALLFLVYRIILAVIKNHLSALFGTIALAFSYEYWSQSQNTEAFIFTYFFVALFAYLIIRTLSMSSQATFKTFILIAFLYGLAIGANPTVLSLVPGLLYIMYLNRKFFNLKRLLILGFVFLITMILVYSYLPIRASSFPFLNWGNPQNLQLFIGHLRGAGLNIYEPDAGSINGFTGSPVIFAQSVSNFFVMLLFQFTPILLPFIALGMIFVFRTNKRLFFFLLSVPITNVIYAGIYYSGNQESWFILSWIFLSIFMALGFYSLVEPARSHLVAYKVRPWKVVGLFSLSFLPFLLYFYPLNRSGHYYSSDYANNLYNHLEKNAIVLGTGDFFNSLSNYVHEADKVREDVTPVTVNMFYVNRWYRDNLREATNLSISNKIEKIIQYKYFWEYNEAMNEFIDENISHHPIYVAHLALRASALVATSGGQLRLDPKFKFIPNGLTLKVVRSNENVKPDLSSYDYKFKSSLTNRPFYLEKNYKAAFLNILNDYIYGYEFLGDYYADRNKDDLALFYYKKAKELSENNVELLAHLGEFYARKKEFNTSKQYFQKAITFDPRNTALHFNLGLSLASLGKVNDAKQEFEAVKALSRINDPIYNDADNIIRQIEPQYKSKWSFCYLQRGLRKFRNNHRNCWT